MMDSTHPVASEFAFETAAVRLAGQSSEIDALDAKVGIALAADGVLAGLVFGVRPGAGSAWIVVTAALSLAGSGVAALLSFWPRRYALVPDVRALATMCAANPHTSSASLKWRFIRNAVEAVERNQRLLHHKVLWLKVSAVALLAAIVSLVANAAMAAIRT
jgi:hypothetical protein